MPATQRQENLYVTNYLLKRIGVTMIYPIYLLREIVVLLSSLHTVFKLSLKHKRERERKKERERTCKYIWTDTPTTLCRFPEGLCNRLNSTLNLNQLLNWLLFIWLLLKIFIYSKLSISLVWCHLTKLLRQIMIITCVPNIPYVSILPQSNLGHNINPFYLRLAFLSRDDRCPLSYVRTWTRLTFPIWFTFPLKDFS